VIPGWAYRNLDGDLLDVPLPPMSSHWEDLTTGVEEPAVVALGIGDVSVVAEVQAPRTLRATFYRSGVRSFALLDRLEVEGGGEAWSSCGTPPPTEWGAC
jgi:hypothetical protein